LFPAHGIPPSVTLSLKIKKIHIYNRLLDDSVLVRALGLWWLLVFPNPYPTASGRECEGDKGDQSKDGAGTLL